jgi:hypothetical protein
MFGMDKNSTEQNNKNRQVLGKYQYNFSYSFNQKGELYAIHLTSDAEKAITFDTALKAKYDNLNKIIHTKYGEPINKRGYPSIFDVQNAKTLWLNSWEEGAKQIRLGLVETDLNKYKVRCRICDTEMEKEEMEHARDIKNKDIIEAAKKF